MLNTESMVDHLSFFQTWKTKTLLDVKENQKNTLLRVRSSCIAEIKKVQKQEKKIKKKKH